MSDLFVVAGLVAGTCSFIVLGVALGTRYIDKTFSMRGRSRDKSPLVRPAHPSGLNWHSVDAA